MGLLSMYDDVHLSLLTLIDMYPIKSLKTDILPESTPVIFANFYHAYAVMIKQAARLQRTIDTENALAGTVTFVLDSYMDGAVYNPQAIAKLVIA
ncbi:phage major capsid protein, HK97 family (plasmid) [Bacillus cereus]|uniref:phage major capsid protein n=1 Tax=Bacillus tropicus TaxID=2026188 RepID=UPI0005A3372A|nr:phage major capsid protein [Bacillus tropicus]AJG91275.1 phage major capsid protein, HK97 family [Bacillus cereus]